MINVSGVVGLVFLPDSPLGRYGLLVVGSSPGGGQSNLWTALWAGDLDLSVTMTFLRSALELI